MSDSNLNEEHQSAAAGGGMGLQDYYFAVKERLWLVLLVFVVCIAAGVVYFVRTEPVYGSRCVLTIEQREQKLMGGREPDLNQNDPSTPDVVNTIVESIRSRTVLARVVVSLDLKNNTDFMEKKEDGSPRSEGEAVEKLAKSVKVVLRPRTRMVDISAEHTKPEMARVLADAVAKEFIRFGFEQRMQSSTMAREFLLEEAAKLRDKVRMSEEALQKYRETNNAASLENNQNLVLEQLKDLSSRLNQARSQRLSLETDQSRAKEVAGQTDEMLKIPSIVKLPSVVSVINAITSKENDLSLLQEQYLPKHPKYIAAASEIESLKRILVQKVNEGAELLEADYQGARENEKRLTELVAQQEAVSLELNKKAIDYNVIKRELETSNTIYQSVLSRVKELDVTRAIDGSPIKLTEAATTTDQPIRPRLLVTAFLSVMMGLGLGIGSALGLNILNPGLKTVTQAESRLGLPVFSAIPYQKMVRGQSIEEADGPHGLVKEAFRTLRTSLMLLGKQEDRRTFLVTSALPSEGKTFISCNMATALAQGGMKTLLIDADLRKPTVSEVFFGRNESPGLTELLQGRTSFHDVVRETKIANLSIMTAGERARNPAELLTKKAIKDVIDEALKTYDRVIIDTAPVLAVSDTLLIVAEADTVCLAVMAGATPAGAVERACTSLTDAGNGPAGIVMNKMRGGQSYYYYGHYGSKEVYGAPVAGSNKT